MKSGKKMKSTKLLNNNYIKYITIILVVMILILWPEKKSFKEIRNDISFNTICHSTFNIFNNDNCVHQDVNIILEKFDNLIFTKTYKIERIQEYYDLSGIKNNEIIFVKVYANGYLEIKDKNYYYIVEDYSLYDKLTNILLK